MMVLWLMMVELKIEWFDEDGGNWDYGIMVEDSGLVYEKITPESEVFGRVVFFLVERFFLTSELCNLTPIYTNFHINMKEKQVTLTNCDQLKANKTNWDQLETSMTHYNPLNKYNTL